MAERKSPIVAVYMPSKKDRDLVSKTAMRSGVSVSELLRLLVYRRAAELGLPLGQHEREALEKTGAWVRTTPS